MRSSNHFDSLAGKPTAVLVRVSSTHQETESQIEALREFISRWGLVVAEKDWFIDQGRSRMEEWKAKALPLLKAAVARGEYEIVLTFSQNRGGYLNDFKFGTFCDFLLENGCELWDTTGRLNDPLDIGRRVETVVGNAASAKELSEKAYHTIRGKVHTAREGRFNGGHVPYGMDVAIYGSDGQEKWRIVVAGKRRWKKVWPDGREELYQETSPSYDKCDEPRLAPSNDTQRLQMAKQVFQWYASGGWTANGIARELMRLGIKPYYGTTWQGCQVKRMLSNPTYIGRPVWGRSGEAKCWQYINGEYTEVRWHKNRPQPKRKKDEADWVLPREGKEIIPLLSDGELWNKVQVNLAQDRSFEAPRRKEMWLAKLLYCAGCEQRMVGCIGNPKHRKVPCYSCSSYKVLAKGNPAGCWRNTMKAEVIDTLVEQYLDECAITSELLVQAEEDPACLKPLLERLQMTHAQWYAACRAVDNLILEALPEGESCVTTDGQVTDTPHDPSFVRVIKYPDHRYEIISEPGMPALDLYRYIWQGNKTKLVNQIADLERQREDLYTAMKEYKSAYARKKADAEMDQLSGQIEQVGKQLARQDERLLDSHKRLMELQGQIGEARKALTGDQDRAKIETVRKVIDRIVCTFEKCPGHRSQQPSTQLVQVEIIPRADSGLKAKVCGPSDMARGLDIVSAALSRTFTRAEILAVSNRRKPKTT